MLLAVDDGARLKACARSSSTSSPSAGIDLRNVEQKDPEISPLGHSRQEFAIKQGLDGDKAKEITKAIKALGLKVQATLQDRQVRVTGSKKDDLQKVIGALRAADFGVGLAFKNFRD